LEFQGSVLRSRRVSFLLASDLDFARLALVAQSIVEIIIPLRTLVLYRTRSSVLHIISVGWIERNAFHLHRSRRRPSSRSRRCSASNRRLRTKRNARDGEAAVGIPRGNKAAPCMSPESPARPPPPRHLALNDYPRYYLYRCPASFRVIPFLPPSYVTAARRARHRRRWRPLRPPRVRCRRSCASSARVLCAKPGEHSFAEEAKVANYREASREGGLMRRSPMTDHIRSPPFCFCPRAPRCRPAIPRWRQRAPTAA